MATVGKPGSVQGHSANPLGGLRQPWLRRPNARPGTIGAAATLLWALVGGPGCHQGAGAGGKCGSPDASGETKASDASGGIVSNDPRCPSGWSSISPGGLPAACTVNGLVCTYPEGQAECAPDGSVLEWWTVGATNGCAETAPKVGAGCGSPGLTCEYITGAPSSSTFVTSYCCDGTRCAWDLQGSEGCPKGNTCGAIHASDYDQSCSVDSDCVLEPEGDFCAANTCTDCAGAAVSVKAQAQYEADLASKISTPFSCPCPSPPPAICDNGRCALGSRGAPRDASAGN
jgi:hypothetical protein